MKYTFVMARVQTHFEYLQSLGYDVVCTCLQGSQNYDLDEYTDVLYDMQKANAIPNAINVVLIIVYFIVFQYLNKGQTIGKKLLKIKIVNEDKKDISLKQMLIRGIMMYSILSSIINIILFFNVSRKVYMTSYLSIGGIETLILFLSAIFILYRNDKKALHDIVSKSIVIKEN